VYICSFIFTKEPPVADRELRDVSVGELSDGLFETTSFPALVRFGAFIEVAVEPHDVGEFEVGVGMTDATAPALASGTEEGELDIPVFETVPLPVAPADDDWNTPRSVAMSFRISYETSDETDDLLWAVILGQNEEPIDSLPKGVVVRLSTHIPDFMPES
jgi:hypothetical protein